MSYFLENAKILKSFDELPKIGDKHAIFNAWVVSVTAYQEESDPGYLFYRVIFGESFNKNDIKYFDLCCDCCSFTYAIKKADIFTGD